MTARYAGTAHGVETTGVRCTGDMNVPRSPSRLCLTEAERLGNPGENRSERVDTLPGCHLGHFPDTSTRILMRRSHGSRHGRLERRGLSIRGLKKPIRDDRVSHHQYAPTGTQQWDRCRQQLPVTDVGTHFRTLPAHEIEVKLVDQEQPLRFGDLIPHRARKGNRLGRRRAR